MTDTGDEWRRRLHVEETKVVGYLLSLRHPFGRSKALFFERLGYSAASPGPFRAALLAHAAGGQLVSREETQFGLKYVVEGPLRSLAGDDPLVRSVWFEEEDLGPVRLVTAYPAGGR